MKFKMKIESGIPVAPIKREGAVRKCAQLMKAGDSVLLPTNSKVAHLKKELILINKKPIVRKVEGGWRVWSS